ncbi:hypothetical protein BC629DRAFT_1289608 [Irpex lacteus]|nr:hypothetical protein BC629DRAFT_1289608 [Irpex lacteus]
MTPHATSSLLNLPSEVTESIIVLAAAFGSPTAVSAVAQTCRSLRQLVYDAPDRHLWRELFLATFDDPRYVLAEGGIVPEYEEDKGVAEEAIDAFDWGGEFRARVWARNYLRSPSNSKGKSSVTRERHELNTNAISTVLRMIETARPSPPVLILARPSSQDSDSDDETPSSWAPTFPPAPSEYKAYLNDKGSSDFASKLPTPSSSGPFEPDVDFSVNIRWLQEMVANGLPPDLIKKLSGKRLYGGLQGVWDSPALAHEMRAFCQLICCTGFVPIPQPDEPVATEPKTTPTPASNADGESLLFSNRPALGVVDASSTDELPMTIKDQRIRARRFARMRVYNLRYLNQARHWGPYLLPDKLDNTASKADVSRMFLGPVLDFLRDHLETHWLHQHDDDSDDEADHDHSSSDGEYVDANDEEDTSDDDSDYNMTELETDGAEDQSSTRNQDDGSEHDEGEQDPGEEYADEPDTQSHEEDGHVPARTPTPSELRADWTFLAAARIVIEENLRQFVEPNDLAGLLSLELLRRHSAPKVLKAPEDFQRSAGSPSQVVEGGWDWAGVTGSWRRCVCWMDYRALISYFPDVLIREANRIVPTEIHIESYSPCSIPKYRHRPDIHVVATVTSQHGVGPIRRMKGTVGMIGDGNIRWSMYSLVEGEESAEWASEGVQVGQAKSGVGILGMWTGAQHDRMDPLGPFWMWKVG